MNNREFINAVSRSSGISPQESQQLVESLVSVMADILDEGDSIAIQGYGTFEAKKKAERIIVNPATKQRQLIPPKLAIGFKPSATLKDKFKK